MKQNKNKKPRRKNKTIEPDPQGLQYYDETNLKKKNVKPKNTHINSRNYKIKINNLPKN